MNSDKSEKISVKLAPYCKGETAVFLNPWKLFFCFCLLSVLLPKIRVAGLLLGLDDIVGLAGIFFLFTTLTIPEKNKVSHHLVVVLYLFCAFFLFAVLVGTLNGFYVLNGAHAPTELWQYARRLGFLCGGYFYIKSCSTPEDYSVGWIVLIVVLVLAVGLMQYPMWSIGEVLSHVYERTDRQAEMLIGRGLNDRRIFGVAGFSTAWGGFCAALASLGLALVFIEHAMRGLLRKTGLVLFLMAIMNVVLSGSRAAMVAAIVGVGAMLFLFTFDRHSALRYKLYVMAGFLSTAFVAFLLLMSRGEFILFRFVSMIETGGGSRREQVALGLGLLQGGLDWLFGVGNAVQRACSVGHGIEVEPVYLLVNYGIIGFLLLMAVLGVIFLSALGLTRDPDAHSRFLGYTVFGMVVTYMVFWFGYFFFQELIVGQLFWLLAGMVIGARQYRRSLL